MHATFLLIGLIDGRGLLWRLTLFSLFPEFGRGVSTFLIGLVFSFLPFYNDLFMNFVLAVFITIKTVDTLNLL